MNEDELQLLVEQNSDLFHTRWPGVEFLSGWGGIFGETLKACRREQSPLITRTKQKLGCLRVYFEDQSDPAGRAIREEVIRCSERICEICGAEGESLVISPGTRATRCPEHRHLT